MGGLTGAWLAGVSIVAWREVRQSHRMPIPANLLGVTGLFVGLMLIGDISTGARPVVTLLGWGLDVAGLLQVLPNGLFGQIQQAQSSEAAAEGETTNA
jgi:hypothetical protein